MRVHSKPAPTVLYPVDRPLRPITPLTTTATQSASSTAKSADASSASASASAPTAPASSAKSSSSGKGGTSSSANAGEEASALAAVYSTTVAGKTYSGSVEESDGQYTASVSNLPGASASGSSVQGAEDNLGSVIDVIA